MQICDCTVRLGGSVLHTVRKVDVTPAEIAILQHLHGEDSVVEITRKRMSKRSHALELARLDAIYYADRTDNGTPIYVARKLFGNAVGGGAKLPVDLLDIGISGDSHLMGQPPKSVMETERQDLNALDGDMTGKTDEEIDAQMEAETAPVAAPMKKTA